MRKNFTPVNTKKSKLQYRRAFYKNRIPVVDANLKSHLANNPVTTLLYGALMLKIRLAESALELGYEQKDFSTKLKDDEVFFELYSHALAGYNGNEDFDIIKKYPAKVSVCFARLLEMVDYPVGDASHLKFAEKSAEGQASDQYVTWDSLAEKDKSTTCLY